MSAEQLPETGHLNDLYRIFPVLSTGEQTETPEIVARYHDRLTQVVDSLRNGEGIGFMLEGMISHGAWLKTRDYLKNQDVAAVHSPLSDTTYSREFILNNYSTESDANQGNNLGNVLTTANALDRALHDPQKQREIVTEITQWGKSTQTLDKKLVMFPHLNRVVWNAAVTLHAGYSFGRNDPDSTWVWTSSQNRTKSYVVAASLVDNLIHSVTSNAATNTVEEEIRAPTFYEIKQLHDFDKILTPHNTEITALWDFTMQRVRFPYNFEPDKERILAYRDVLTSANPMVNRGQVPLTVEQATKYIWDKMCEYRTLSTVDFAGLAAHHQWLEGQSTQTVRYQPNQYMASRETVETSSGPIKIDPRNAHYIFLQPGDLLNNDRAAYTLWFIGHSDIITALKDGHFPYGREGFNLFLQSILFDFHVHGPLYDGNPMLERLSSIVHDPWATATFMREGKKAALQNRADQIRLYLDLENDVKAWDRKAVAGALPPFTAGVMAYLWHHRYPVRYIPEIQPQLEKLVTSATVIA